MHLELPGGGAGRRLPALALLTSVLLVAAAPRASGQARSSDSAVVTVGAFVDAYYAFDTRRPAGLDRAFTTQPARHNEFNVNLAFVEVRLTGPAVRGRLALQAGTSVQANYAGEPRLGSVSGPDLSRLLQEATVGVRLRQALWLDGGVFFSHIGAESWISGENWTYTRSLVAEFTPYYSAGVRAIWTATPRLTAHLNVVNGWQNISETNSAKSIGARIDAVVRPGVTLTYDNFFGNEAPDSARRRLRSFHEVSLRRLGGSGAGFLLLGQHGAERRPDGPGRANWRGAVAIVRVRLRPRVAATARAEAYSDPEQVIVPTGASRGFRARGASLGLDVAAGSGVSWRTELRAFRFGEPVYPTRRPGRLASDDAFLVTSLSLTAPALTLAR